MPDATSSLIPRVTQEKDKLLSDTEQRELGYETGTPRIRETEKKVEMPEREKAELEAAQQKNELEHQYAASIPPKPTRTAAHKEEDASAQQLKKIEQVLENGLGKLYIQMDAEHKQLFKTMGEETAKTINRLLEETKVKVQKIFELVKSWLKIIPGVSKWFIIQEAKIKTDRIMRLKGEKDDRH